jgi:hypothetical protein
VHIQVKKIKEKSLKKKEDKRVLTQKKIDKKDFLLKRGHVLLKRDIWQPYPRYSGKKHELP